ncbi:MAG TPA: hypothetical protein VFX31_00545, partial [Ktedonobacterales bacterium]|nr:hypothetical protein [Ktedonobacterales bacterium]
MPKVRVTRGAAAIILSAVVAMIILVIVVAVQQREAPHQVDLSTLLADVRVDVAAHRVDTLTVDSATLTLDRGDGNIVQTTVGPGFSLADALQRDSGVPYNNPHVLQVAYEQPSAWSSVGNYIVSLLLIGAVV